MLYMAGFSPLTRYYLSINERFPTYGFAFTFVNNYTLSTYYRVYKS